MDNTTEFLLNIINQSGSYDIARAEFQRMISDDAELRSEYEQWCEEHDFTPRTGFDELCERHRNNSTSIWESLNDFDE